MVPLPQLFDLPPLHYTHHIYPTEITRYENNITALRPILSKHITHFSAKKAATTTTGISRQVCFRLTLKDSMIFSKSDTAHVA